MTIKYRRVLDKLNQIDQVVPLNSDMLQLRNLLRERDDHDIDRILEDRGNLRLLILSLYE